MTPDAEDPAASLPPDVPSAVARARAIVALATEQERIETVAYDICVALLRAVEALEEIADSTTWGEDTAIKREITSLQRTARECLASLGVKG